jgi:hypothetical protein
MRSPRGGAGERLLAGPSSDRPAGSAEPRLTSSGERLIAPRKVDPESVLVLDDALTFAAGAPVGSVVHAMSSSPHEVTSRLWSVAFASGPGIHLYVTCGLSGRIDLGDDRAPFTWELSIAARGDKPPAWPIYLLRYLASYAVTTGRPLRVGDYLPLGGAISRRPLALPTRDMVPDTAMTLVGFTRDPELSTVATPRGDIEVRRVVGFHADEVELFEAWSSEGFLDAIGSDRAIDLSRASLAAEPVARAAVEEGSKRDGSAYGFLDVPGLRWSRDGGRYRIEFGSAHARRRAQRVISARLPFGRSVLAHDVAPYPQSDVGFEPSPTRRIDEQGGVLVIGLPSDDPLLTADGDASAIELG